MAGTDTDSTAAAAPASTPTLASSSPASGFSFKAPSHISMMPSPPTTIVAATPAPAPTQTQAATLPPKLTPPPPLSLSNKTRRVSLALPSTPRVAWNFRDDTGLESHVAETSTMYPERKAKKMRRISAPDSGPGAGGGSLSDGEYATGIGMIPDKKMRKKWTMEETAMLVKGCNAHGVGNWKAILSDPTLTFDNRSPVDLKDRFRTYYPDAYKKHYPNARTHLSTKIRSTNPDGTSIFEKTRSKKRRPFTESEDRALKAGYEKHGTVWATIVRDPVFQEQGRRSTDLRDRFRNAFPELYLAAGYKPRNAGAKRKAGNDAGGPVTGMPVRAKTDDQLAMSSTARGRAATRRRRANADQGLLRGGTKSVPQSTTHSEDEDNSSADEQEEALVNSPPEESGASSSAEVEMAAAMDPAPDLTLQTTEMTAASAAPSSSSQHHAWSAAVAAATSASPTSSHLSSDYITATAASHRRSASGAFGGPSTSAPSNGMGMIGKSAWGTQDWLLSANPRLDNNTSYSCGSTSSTHSSSFIDNDTDNLSTGLSPSSPFTLPLFHTHSHLHNNLSHTHGVLDRYDLFPTSSSYPHDFISEVGVGDTTFSDEMGSSSFQNTGGGFRGFTHHSNYAGDLIFGARTHQPLYYGSSSSSFGGGGGFGGAFNDHFGLVGLGLGLDLGMQQSTGVHPMQLHTPALPGIDEIELAGISLDDRGETDESGSGAGQGQQQQQTQQQSTSISTPSDAKDDPSCTAPMPMSLDIDDSDDPTTSGGFSSLPDLSDLVDMHSDENEMHSTPPSTPLTSRPRPLRKASFGSATMLLYPQSLSQQHHYPSSSTMGHGHGRSVSVPPTEARGNHSQVQQQQQQRPQQVHTLSQPAMSAGRSDPFFSPQAPRHSLLPQTQSISGNGNGATTTTGTTSSLSAMISPPPPSQQQQQQQLFAFTSDSSSSSSCAPAIQDYPAFLDLHYYNTTSNTGHHHSALSSHGSMETFPEYGQYTWYGQGGPGEVLDLAQSSMSMMLSGAGGSTMGGHHHSHHHHSHHHLHGSQHGFGIGGSGGVGSSLVSTPPPQSKLRQQQIFTAPDSVVASSSPSTTTTTTTTGPKSLAANSQLSPIKALSSAQSLPGINTNTRNKTGHTTLTRSNSMHHHHSHTHQRGQSVTSANRKSTGGGSGSGSVGGNGGNGVGDGALGGNSNNKRKRASWDGGLV